MQTVTREANSRYHALISAFRDLTGVPVVLNTSFNDNEPIVCRPEEAIDCFQRTQMDALVLGDLLVARQGQLNAEAPPRRGREGGRTTKTVRHKGAIRLII